MKSLGDLRPVYVAGIGLHRYQRIGDTSFVQLGLTATRAALEDAGLAWRDVDQIYTGTATSGMAVSMPILRHLGVTGIPMTQVENASASGSSALRLAAMTVAAELSDVCLTLGVDKGFQQLNSATRTGVSGLADHRIPPPAHFALLASEYIDTYGATPAQLATVAVKNHRNGASNPYAQRQKARTLEEVMDDAPIAGVLTRLQCCPIGEGAAAAIVVAEEAIERFGIDRSRCVRIASSVQASEELYGTKSFDAELTRRTTCQAMGDAGVRPEDLDVVELHDAFTIEELQYVEAIGLCGEGEAAAEVVAGAFDIGGRTAVSASGGLIAMGHPTGPTGVGQVAEITRQLRGEAGVRQQPGAHWGLAHMVGLGAVCVAHVLEAPEARR